MIPQLVPALSSGFSLAAFMAAQSAGFWYDFTRSDTMFQEDVGPTPADEPNEVIGMALSQRLWLGKTRDAFLAGQPEKITNGDFASATGWTLGAGWTISGGKATLDGSYAPGSSRDMTQAAGLTVGRVYRVTMDVTNPGNISTGTITILAAGQTVGTAFAAATSSQSITGYFVANSTSAVISYTRSTTLTGNLSIDNLSIKEVSQVSATQTTSSYKPKFQLVGATGDATDDALPTNYAAGSGENFVMLPGVSVPATIPTVRALVGAADGASNGAFLSISAQGWPRVTLGSTLLVANTLDLRGGVHDIGFWTDSGTLYLYVDGVVAASGAWAGTIPTTTWNLFSLNNNGTASNFFGGSLSKALAGRDTIDLATANLICATA